MELIENKSDCKGLIFRGKVNKYINSKGEYVVTKRMSPLKRNSCSGCKECGWLMDELFEFISNDYDPFQKEVEHNKLYRLIVTNITEDWETGYVDDYDLMFIEQKI